MKGEKRKNEKERTRERDKKATKKNQ